MSADPPGGAEIRIVVVDDQALVRAGNALILDSEDDLAVIGEAGNGAEALAVIATDPPDVVLMDVRMPGMDGIEATRLLIERHPETRVIVLTTFDLDEYAFASLQAGASAFLLKSATPAALVSAVRTVASGSGVVMPGRTSALIAHSVPGARASGGPSEASAAAARMETLSPRERDVFLAIVRGLTNPEISAELFLAHSTVKSHVNAVFAKLELRDRVHAVILGYELGLAPRSV